MYDFRSRLIHGDLDLRYQHNDHDAEPEFEQFWDQIHECEDLATAVLLATLQKLCLKRTYSLDFKYALK